MEKILYEIIHEFIDKNIYKIKPSMYLVQDLGINSLDLIEISMKLEERFNIHIPDRKISKFRTVQDILNYLNSVTLRYRL